MSQIVSLSVAVIGLSYMGVAALRRWAETHHALDVPNERSSHDRPIPRAGGLAIVAITLVGIFVFWLHDPAWPSTAITTFMIGAGCIAYVSLVDDLYGVSRNLRLFVHGLSAILVILGFGFWQTVSIPIIGELHLGWLGLPITFLWIVGLTNAYNFMDGIDGLAGGQAVVAGSAWVLLGWVTDQFLVGGLGMLAAASSLGFLGHNWYPARIFMGDVGSLFLGYTFAVLSVIAAHHNPALALSGVLILWPFVFDTTFTLLRRLYHGENILVAHRSHLYQRLLIVGHSHHFLSLLYVALAVVGAGLAYLFTREVPGSAVLVGLLLPVLCLALWSLVVWEERKRARQLRPQVPSLVDTL